MVPGQTARARAAALALVLAAALLATLGSAPGASAATGDAFGTTGLGDSAAQLVAAQALPPGVTESVAFSGLTNPTAVRFAPDGRVFVAEKSGLVKVFDGLGDPTATTFADLRTQVHDFWDRGLLGLALDPSFATRPYVYVLYAYNKAPGSTQVPRWPDSCPTPPGATDDGCVITGRLSRLSAGASEQVLIEDFCQQYPSHSIGGLAFGADGALYLSAGDGASFNWADYGQDGSPVNPCGDPPGGVGGAMSPPTAQGGALRSQDIRTPADPTGLDGAILRVNPDTGAALPSNPNAGSSDAGARRIVAHGLRNPFRIAVRPGTNEVWAGDVGWFTWEEIDRIVEPTAGTRNFGWPCYEGADRNSSYDNLNLSLCENLYAEGDGAHAQPYYTYSHSSKVVPGESCPSGGSSISGLAFYPSGGSLGPEYAGALFFSDYSRNCIWVMYRGANGLPDPATRQTFVAGAAGPVELQVGPGGDLFYVDMQGGTIRRLRGTASNQAPTAAATANPASGAVPLTVSFSAAGSSDPDPGDVLTYAWDLDGDGAYDDATSGTPSRTYTTAEVVRVGLRVTDRSGLSDTDTVTITAGTPPEVSIDTPAAGTTWRAGDTVAFSGSARDFQGNAIPPSGLSWRVNLEHCNRADPSNCHTHVIQSSTGATGSLVAPEHDYPSHLELQLTAVDGSGLSRTVTRRLDPRTVPITLRSEPAGIELGLGGETAAAPFTLDVIQGSRTAITAPSPVTSGGTTYEFAGWSDGGARTHDIVPGSAPATYTATYTRSTAPVRIAGTDVVGSTGSEATAGRAEVYRTVASADGRVTALRLRLAANSTASALVLGLYADSGGQATTLLASGRLDAPQAGAWNEVAIASGPALSAGTPYWIGLLNPAGSTGVLRWHDRAGGSGGAEQGSASGTLSALPATWATGALYSDGPLSGSVLGVPLGPPPPPALGVTPASLSFSGTAGGPNPAAKTLSVANTGGGSLSFTASDDAPWVSVSPGSGTAPRDLSVAVSTAGLAAGTHTANVRVEAAGASGSPKTVPVTLTVSSPATGLVGAWGFDEAGGTTASDASGRGNPGTISGATRAAGRFGGGLSFDGVNDLVTVADAPSLDLTRAMTLEGWVRPAALGDWRTLLLKEQPGQLVYALYANTDAPQRPSAHVFTSGDMALRGPATLPLNAWSHLAMTWDGLTLRLYVDGTLRASSALSGTATTSAGALRIGGNTIWSEWFRGLIDEVRVYDRALSAAEVAADRDRPVGGGA